MYKDKKWWARHLIASGSFICVSDVNDTLPTEKLFKGIISFIYYIYI